jgi:hypothetical protein
MSQACNPLSQKTFVLFSFKGCGVRGYHRLIIHGNHSQPHGLWSETAIAIHSITAILFEKDSRVRWIGRIRRLNRIAASLVQTKSSDPLERIEEKLVHPADIVVGPNGFNSQLSGRQSETESLRIHPILAGI